MHHQLLPFSPSGNDRRIDSGNASSVSCVSQIGGQCFSILAVVEEARSGRFSDCWLDPYAS
ncbi:hypothetical protein W911_04525 [Hyphomicrobium nitrativorans NL23]|uniref:Uncharacterized protein n=1 Tax=Hyphomicrobium nitrativorans NL23 TaxID=1029756 RepID=V5SGF6_9HYPH|nr:hypothetical protein W911_04525 [Hyphomicrobium nitrativorans NL23]